MINALRTALLVKFGLILAFDLACVILGLVLPGASHADTGLMWGVYIHGAPQSARSLDDFEALIGATPDIVHWYQPWSMGTGNSDEAVLVDRNVVEQVAGRGAEYGLNTEDHRFDRHSCCRSIRVRLQQRMAASFSTHPCRHAAKRQV